QSHVTQVPLDWKVLQVAVAAEDLKRRISRAGRRLRRVELRFRRRGGEAQPRVGQGGGAVHEQSRRVELRARACETPLDHLELGDRPPELPTFLRVSDRDLERRAAEPDRERADADASSIEYLLDMIERFAVAADPIGGRDAAILEDELRGVGRVQTHLFLALAHPEAWSPLP